VTFRAIAIGNDLSAAGAFLNFSSLFSRILGFDEDSAGKMTFLKTPGITSIQKRARLSRYMCEASDRLISATSCSDWVVTDNVVQDPTQEFCPTGRPEMKPKHKADDHEQGSLLHTCSEMLLKCFMICHGLKFRAAFKVKFLTKSIVPIIFMDLYAPRLMKTSLPRISSVKLMIYAASSGYFFSDLAELAFPVARKFITIIPVKEAGRRQFLF